MAYGAPPSNVSSPGLQQQQQFSPPPASSSFFQKLKKILLILAQPPVPFSMPNYSLPNTFIPQQPPVSSVPQPYSNPTTLPFNSFPMPSLSDLGIKELVPQPTPSYTNQPPPSVPPQVPNF